MKKRIINLSLLGLLILAIAVPVTAANTKQSNNFDMSAWGSYLQKDANHLNTGKRKAAAKKTSDVIWAGKHTTIHQSDLNLTKTFYRLSGQTEEEALDSALSYLMEHEALYYKATESGYQATDQEVNEIVDKIRSSFEDGSLDTESSRQMKEVIAQFDSEDAYWDYEKQIYRKDLPIMKMNQDNEAAFYKKHPNASEADYQKWFTDYKQKLIEQEDFQQI